MLTVTCSSVNRKSVLISCNYKTFLKGKNIKRDNNLCISRGPIKSSKTKEKLYKVPLDPTINNEQNYKKCRNKLNHLIRIAKKSYYCKKI